MSCNKNQLKIKTLNEILDTIDNSKDNMLKFVCVLMQESQPNRKSEWSDFYVLLHRYSIDFWLQLSEVIF